MRKVTLTLEAGSAKIQDALCIIDNLVAAEDQSCWTALLAIRQLERARIDQIRLLHEYQKHFAGTHWTVNIVLNTVLQQTHDAGVQTRIALDSLFRLLQSQESALSPQAQQQLQSLSVEVQSMLDTKLGVLYRMIDLLIFAPQRPVTQTPLRLIK
jgi:hypothetical protein